MDEQRSKNVKGLRGRVKASAGREGGSTSPLLEVKALVKFLKENKIEHYKNGDIDLKFSPLAHLPELPTGPSSSPVDENELLYYSAGDRPA